MLPLSFVPYVEVGERANVVVDGAPLPSTRLTLSHWPGAPTPPELRADLSAEIALAARDRPARFDGLAIVTNNHFDQDGLMSAFVLVDPDGADRRRSQLVDVARAGDFGTFASRDAARLALAIAALEDPDRSTLPPSVLAGDYGAVCGRLYEEMLPHVPEWLDDIERTHQLWADEDAHLGQSIEAIERGVVTVDEDGGRDLAVVTVPDDWATRVTHRFTRVERGAVHPMAVANATSCLRLLTVQGASVRLELRYESWVMLVSRPVARRVPTCGRWPTSSPALEPGGVRWSADPPGALTPTLAPVGGATDLDPALVRARIDHHLDTSPAAWDPFAPRP